PVELEGNAHEVRNGVRELLRQLRGTTNSCRRARGAVPYSPLMRFLAFVLALGLASAASAHPAPTASEVAPRVRLFRTEPYGDVGLDGNSVAIVGEDGVLVFDANGTPDAARAVLKQIREVTDQPVGYLVYSHWHWDHWYGGEVYRDSFPDLVVISHEATRK